MRALSLIGSRRLSAVLMTLLISGYVVWVLPFQFYGVPLWRVQNIATAWPFQLLGAALAVNNLVCTALRVQKTWQRATTFRVPTIEKARVRVTEIGSCSLRCDVVLDRIARVLKHRGYQVRTSDDERLLAATKGRLSALFTIGFHVAILLVAFVPYLGASDFRGKATLVEGESFDGSLPESWFEPTREEVEALGDRLPRVAFTLDTVETAFWRDVQLFTKLIARITYGAGERAAIAVNRSVTIDGYQVAVDGFGYAPEFRFVPTGAAEEGLPEEGFTNDAATIQEGFVKLKVFPPGTVDDFELPGTALRIKLSVFPDAEVIGKEVVNRSYNLRDPAIAVSVEDITREGPQAEVFAGIVRPGEPIVLPEGRLSFPSIRHYAELRVVRNLGTPLFLGAIGGAFVATALRFFWRRREVLVIVDEEPAGARIFFGARAEYWRAAHEIQIARLIGRVAQCNTAVHPKVAADDIT